MMKKVFFKCITLTLLALWLTACHNSTSQNAPGTLTGTLAIQVPNSFPYNTTETITVNLSSTATGPGLGYSNLTLNTNPRGSLSLLTISPSSTCYAITPTSTATSCTFTVINNSSTGETTLDNTGYYVTGTLGGQTITSNVAYPAGSVRPSGSYWSITINNQTGANQHLFVFGQNLQVSNSPHEVVVFDGNFYGTPQVYSATTNYGSDNDSVTLPPGNTVIHIPYGISGGRAYFSNQKMVGLNLTSDGGIVTPSFTSNGGANLNYNTIFDDFEFTYAQDPVVTTTYSAVINQTQVDALSVPICIVGTSNYSPITTSGFCNISRATLLSDVDTAFGNITDNTLKAQWKTTELKDGSNNILRIMNPGSSDAIAGTSPITSFANYLSTYATDLFNSLDYSASDSLKVSLDGNSIISGKIAAGPEYQFTCSGPACAGQSGTMPLSSVNLLTGAAPGGANEATILAYEMISSAFMAGQLPPTQQSLSSVITQSYLRNLSPNTFYQSNSVSSAGQYQYSVFSSALRAVQLSGTYTFPYNDVLGISSTMTETLTGPTDQPDHVTVTLTY